MSRTGGFCRARKPKRRLTGNPEGGAFVISGLVRHTTPSAATSGLTAAEPEHLNPDALHRRRAVRCVDTKRRELDAIDSELIILGKHRTDALDEIIRRFVEIVGIDNRVDVLLLRRHEATAPMIHR